MSRLRVGVVMDPIATIKPKKDTTLALLLEARRRGHELHYMEQSDLWLRDGAACAHRRLLDVRDDPKSWFSFTGETTGPLAQLDVILMRKDPPVDQEYLYATYILERAQADGVLVVNRPEALRAVQEKLYTAWFAHLTPPTLVASAPVRVREFLAEHQDIIVKPLDLMGGASIFRLRQDDPNVSVVLELMTRHASRPVMAQRYVPEIVHGDKRLLLIDGQAPPYALARIPQAGETRGNLAAGGRGEGRELTARDREICAAVGPHLRELGLVFVGLDVIGDYLTEINVTSPTCVRELDAIYGINLAARLWDAIEARGAA